MTESFVVVVLFQNLSHWTGGMGCLASQARLPSLARQVAWVEQLDAHSVWLARLSVAV